MTTFPTATHYTDRIEFIFPYDAAMVEDIKTVPVVCRSYDPKARIWTVRTPHADRVLSQFLRRFSWADVIDERHGGRTTAPPPPPRASTVTPHSALYVLPSAPPEVIEAAYKALVKLHHPDRLPAPERARGNETLARINAAYAQLTGGR